jgi:hypothetical protein
MTNLKLTESPDIAPDRTAVALFRGLAGSRIGLLVIAGAAIVTGLGFSWSWLVPAGVAPLIVGVLPCVAMCALGFCMMGIGKNVAAQPPADQATRMGSAALPTSNEQLEVPVRDPSPVDAE